MSEVDTMRRALLSIAKPEYGIGFNKLRGIARKALIDLYGPQYVPVLTGAPYRRPTQSTDPVPAKAVAGGR